MRSRFAGLLFTTIAFLALSALSEKASEERIDESLEGYDPHLFARRILARDLEDIRAEFGDGVDTSLEGYSHDLAARDILAKRGGYGKAPLQIRDEIAEQVPDLIHEHGRKVDLSLEGYDHELVGRSLEGLQEGEVGSMSGLGGEEDDRNLLGGMNAPHIVHVRRVSDLEAEEQPPSSEDAVAESRNEEESRESVLTRRAAFMEEEAVAREHLGDGIDHSLEGYDSSILERDLEGEESDEREPKFIDYSLEGHDHHLVARSMKSDLGHGVDTSNEPASLEKRTVKGPLVQAKRSDLELAVRTVRRRMSSAWSHARRWVEERLQ